MESRAATESLIPRARRGDRTAFDRLAEGVRERLEAIVRSRLGPSARRSVDVDDIVQETLLRAFDSMRRFEEGDVDAFVRWLGGIAINVVRETSRRHGRELVLPEADELPALGSSESVRAVRNERFDRLQGALDSLSPDHRQVVMLARIERLPLAEVGRRMGRSPEAVSQLLWRALRKLREAFGSTDSFQLPDRRLEDRKETPG